MNFSGAFPSIVVRSQWNFQVYRSNSLYFMTINSSQNFTLWFLNFFFHKKLIYFFVYWPIILKLWEKLEHIMAEILTPGKKYSFIISMSIITLKLLLYHFMIIKRKKKLKTLNRAFSWHQKVCKNMSFLLVFVLYKLVKNWGRSSRLKLILYTV